MSVHPCRGNEVRPRQQAFQCDDCGFWQHRIFVFYFRITISVKSNDSKEIEKDVFRPVTSVGQRKNSESGMRNRTSNLRISAARCFTNAEPTKTLRWAISFTKVQMTRVLHTAGISNVDSVIFENLTQWKALKQLEHSPRKKDTFTVNKFDGFQFVFYRDEFKVWLKI